MKIYRLKRPDGMFDSGDDDRWQEYFQHCRMVHYFVADAMATLRFEDGRAWSKLVEDVESAVNIARPHAQAALRLYAEATGAELEEVES